MIEIACATDDGYAPHCATMLRSLLSHEPRGTVRIHVLHGPLSARAQSGLERVATAAGTALRFLPIDDSRMAGFPSQRFHVSCWYRVLLPELLPTLPRVLYLDSDIVVTDSLAPLWKTPLDGQPFAAVVNPLYPFMSPRWAELGLGAPTEYLNSGVLLMDLERLRAERFGAAMKDYGAAHPGNIWPEQDALSVVYRGRWKALAPRWNAQSTLFDLAPRQLPFDAAQVRDARERPAVVHFIGPLKPWHYLCRHPYRGAYARHRRDTPWPELELEGRTLLNRLLRPFSLGTQVRVRQLMRRMRA